ncbi:caspase family protein [Sandaracinobacteroides saxicola]|uniref:Caspase domain-containing protein n=1 Tax=Sandaracinobacteroides saxicola TaxID=2759707 RepID=A0A7G5IFQ0_9SPHN|nr:caspase family protein [Sandaracinobacteroides saxicola]QMW22192.1 hypothetical protein H3309_12565 [Sandaracinobacteroides saxicola]
MRALSLAVLALVGMAAGCVTAAVPAATSGVRANLAADVPKVVLQFGHPFRVDAALWVPAEPGKASDDWNDWFVLTADASDGSLILWDPTWTLVYDHLRLPPLDRQANFTLDAVTAMTLAPGGRQVTISAIGSGTEGDNPTFARRFTFRLNLDTRVVTREAASVPLPGLDVDTLKPAALPVGPGGTRLERDGTGVKMLPVKGDPVLLKGVARGKYADAALSPDGTRLARVLWLYAGNTTQVEVWDLASGEALPTFIKKGRYDAIRWVNADTYVLLADTDPKTGVPPLPTLLVDAASAGNPKGIAAGTVPGRCMTTVIRFNDGQTMDYQLAATNPAACGGPAGEPDDMWMLDFDGKGGATWRRTELQGMQDRRITSITGTPDGRGVVISTRPLRPVKGGFAPQVVMIDLKSGKVTDSFDFGDADASVTQLFATADSAIQKSSLSSDGKYLFWHAPGGVLMVELATREVRGMDTGTDNPQVMVSDGKTLLVGGVGYRNLYRFDVATVQPVLPPILLTGTISADYLPDRQLFWAVSDDGALRMWDRRDGSKRLSLFTFPNNGFFASMPDGRYDTNLTPDTDWVRWMQADQPWVSLPASAFMRSHYDPGLVRKLFDCNAGGCGAALPPIPPAPGVTRLFPWVTITDVASGGPGVARVSLEFAENVDGATRSGAHDLRLFVDDRMVRRDPDPGSAPDVTDIEAWRRATALADAMPATLPADGEAPTVTRTIDVPIPTDGREVALSAYLFNRDRIKGETDRKGWKPPAATPRPRRLVVLAIGVDATQNRDWRLSYAAADAKAITGLFAGAPAQAKLMTVITSTDARDAATKAVIRAALLSLAGAAGDAERAALAAAGVDSAGLPALTPDDSLVISWSGHGDTIGGQFYLVPSDGAVDAAGRPRAASFISSAELTAWLRGVQAANVAIVIDACHSAASVAAQGFKPGPMGDPGLGQLAYDKGFRILAATQADNVAMEDGALGHGLLTWALTRDALVMVTAEDRLDAKEPKTVYGDLDRDGALDLDEWLRFAVQRLPTLAQEVKSGKLALKANSAARQIVNLGAAVAPVAARPIQKPSLFDFTQTMSEVRVR